MKNLITIAVVTFSACGFHVGHAAAQPPCCHWFMCTPGGPVGQYNAFSPVYKVHCPCCGSCNPNWKHCCFKQFNAFSPIEVDCSGKENCGWMFGCHAAPAAPACGHYSNGCDWGDLGELPDAGMAHVHSDMQVFPQGIVQGQPIGTGVPPLISATPGMPVINPAPAVTGLTATPAGK